MNEQEQQQQLMGIMANGKAEAAREQMKYQERQKATEVADLRKQVNDRLDRLMILTDEVRRGVNEDREQFRFAHGAYGNDTDTLDTLLAALGQETERLTEIRARMRMADEVSEGMAAQVLRLVEESEGGEQVAEGGIPMPTPGQYL